MIHTLLRVLVLLFIPGVKYLLWKWNIW